MDNSDKVDDSHHPHGQIYKAPGGLQGNQCTQHNRTSSHQTEELNSPTLLRDKSYVGLAIKVVGYDGTKGEEENSLCQKESTCGTHMQFHGSLSKENAIIVSVIEPGEENDEGRAATD